MINQTNNFKSHVDINDDVKNIGRRATAEEYISMFSRLKGILEKQIGFCHEGFASLCQIRSQVLVFLEKVTNAGFVWGYQD